jgi:ribosome maturation factor RimP
MLKVGFFFARFFLFCWLRADMAETVIKQIEAVALPVLEEMGLELVEVQYRREQNGWVLRLTIDKQDGINLDDCAAVSREISQLLDIEDIVDQAYNLEVSSPGLNRPLKSMAEFERFVGRLAKIKTVEPIGGEHVFIGKISKTEGESIVLELSGKEMTIFLSQVAKARLEVEF